MGAQAYVGSGRTGGQVDEQTGAGTLGGRGGGRADGLVDTRTVEVESPKGKTPKLMRQLTWPSKIQRGCPWVTVQLCHLPPPSR